VVSDNTLAFEKTLNSFSGIGAVDFLVAHLASSIFSWSASVVVLDLAAV